MIAHLAYISKQANIIASILKANQGSIVRCMKRPIEFVLTVYQDASISYKILEEIGIEIETMLDGELTELQNEIQKLFDKMLIDRINN